MHHLLIVPEPDVVSADTHVAIRSIDFLRVTARRLQPSIDFYRRIFGFRIAEDARDAPEPRVLLVNSRDDVYLHMCEHDDESVATTSTTMRWSFVVDDIDEVREAIWNLGISPVDGADVPQRIESWRKKRSFVIRDPDGHEIELVERLSRRF